MQLLCADSPELSREVRSNQESEDVEALNVTYAGGLAKLTFSVTHDGDKKVMDLYADREHVHTIVFPPDTPHQTMIEEAKSNLFGI